MARKTKASAATAPDTTAGAKAYALAVAHRPEIEPRLPAGTIRALGADLTTLGAAPSSPSSQGAAAPPAAPAGASPSLAESLTTLVNLVTAMHGAITAAKAKTAVHRAYVGAGRGPLKAPKAVLAAAHKLAARAASAPSEAIGLGILPADVAALDSAIASFMAAEALATAPRGGKAAAGAGAGAPAKLKRAAATRMHDATARIAGAGALAFAQSAAIRAEFEALRAKKK